MEWVTNTLAVVSGCTGDVLTVTDQKQLSALLSQLGLVHSREGCVALADLGGNI